MQKNESKKEIIKEQIKTQQKTNLKTPEVKNLTSTNLDKRTNNLLQIWRIIVQNETDLNVSEFLNSLKGNLKAFRKKWIEILKHKKSNIFCNKNHKKFQDFYKNLTDVYCCADLEKKMEENELNEVKNMTFLFALFHSNCDGICCHVEGFERHLLKFVNDKSHVKNGKTHFFLE